MTNLFSSVLVVGFSFCVIGAEEMPISNPNRSSLVQLMDVVSTNIVTREEYVVGNTLSAVAMKKAPLRNVRRDELTPCVQSVRAVLDGLRLNSQRTRPSC